MSLADKKTQKLTLLDSLRQLLGNENVLTAETDLKFFSSDVYREGLMASAVICPASTDELSKAVKMATDLNFPVIPRGGGLSYTDGFLPVRKNSLIVDMQRLNQVIEINTTDMYVVVQAGCTWHKLYNELKKKKLRAPYFGALSGLHSTVGGAMSQNSIFFGSGLHGTAADQCIGLELVLADGRILKTGSWATPYEPSPFFRTYGPDLTGLFLGDTGALGFKTEIVLKVIPYPKETVFASFAFDNFESITRAMSEVSRRGIASECFGFDPYLQGQRLKREGLVKDFKRLVTVARSGKSVFDGIKDATRVASLGRSMFNDVAYSMHLVFDAKDSSEAEKLLNEGRECAKQEYGREIEPSLPKIMRSEPFVPPTSMLGADGERWVPIHALVPHSKAVSLVSAVHNFFEQKKEILEKYEIDWAYLLATVSYQTFLMEPVFFWKDARHSYHDRFLGRDYVKKLKDFPENIGARNTVSELREELAFLFMKMGAVHFQIGKAYKYKDGRNPETWEMLYSLKRYVDPKGLMNPGSLGFD